MKKKTPRAQVILKQLERTKLFVFHGSPKRLATLEPRQQMNYDQKKKRLIQEGRPAVCATPFSDVAMFRAVIRNGWTSFGTKNGRIIYGASKPALNKSKKTKGWVHVLAKKSFWRHSPYEMRAYRRLTPIASIPVTFQDTGHIRRTVKSKTKYLQYIGLK